MPELNFLIDSLGPTVRPKLYKFLCDTRRSSDGSELLDEGLAAALKFLVPLLTKKLGLSKTVATRTAKLILETLAANGREKLCAELGKGQATIPRRKPPKKRKIKKKKEIKSKDTKRKKRQAR